MQDIETPDVQADSSPAIDVPRDPAEYATWRQTGKTPAAAPPKEASAPSKESSEKPAPASEAGKEHQEQSKNKPKRDDAVSRLQELINDLRDAGLTPAELKAFKQTYAKREQPQAEPPKNAAPEHTDKPAGELKAPVKPKYEDFKTLDEWENAKDKYYEDLSDYKVAKALQADRAQRAQEAANQSVAQKMQEASTRYGDEAVGIIRETARAITGDKQFPPAVASILNDSPVWTDLLYTLGGKPEDLAAFVNLAKSDPGAAIRKVVVMEGLVQQELAKGGAKPAAEKAGDADEEPAPADRGSDGKFQKKAPEKQESNAPPPPREVSGRGTPPADEVNRAVKDGDMRAYFRAQNAKDLQRRRG